MPVRGGGAGHAPAAGRRACRLYTGGPCGHAGRHGRAGFRLRQHGRAERRGRGQGGLSDIRRRPLRHYGKRAADNNEEYLPLLERTVQEGHLIALHTCSHDYKSIYKSPDAYWDDLQKLREKLLPYVPADHEIKWLRFPGGSTNTVSHRYGGSDIMKKLKADAESRGFTYVDWNVCAEDSLGGHPSASTIYNNIIREVGDKNTCVVLMHDTNATKNTAAALPDVIRWFKNAGYRFDTVDHLEKKP